jgi:hypothetical protein
MAADIVSGDIKQLTIDHDELGQLVLEHKSTEDATIDKGGFRSEDDDSGITSSLTRINKQTAKCWKLESVFGATDGAYDYLADLAASTVSAVITATFSSGLIRSGSGGVVGDTEHNEQAGTISVKFAGGGKFEVI